MNRLTSDTVVVSTGLTEIVPGIAGIAAKMIGAVSVIIQTMKILNHTYRDVLTVDLYTL